MPRLIDAARDLLEHPVRPAKPVDVLVEKARVRRRRHRPGYRRRHRDGRPGTAAGILLSVGPTGGQTVTVTPPSPGSCGPPRSHGQPPFPSVSGQSVVWPGYAPARGSGHPSRMDPSQLPQRPASPYPKWASRRHVRGAVSRSGRTWWHSTRAICPPAPQAYPRRTSEFRSYRTPASNPYPASFQVDPHPDRRSRGHRGELAREALELCVPATRGRVDPRRPVVRVHPRFHRLVRRLCRPPPARACHRPQQLAYRHLRRDRPAVSLRPGPRLTSAHGNHARSAPHAKFSAPSLIVAAIPATATPPRASSPLLPAYGYTLFAVTTSWPVPPRSSLSDQPAPRSRHPRGAYPKTPVELTGRVAPPVRNPFSAWLAETPTAPGWESKWFGSNVATTRSIIASIRSLPITNPPHGTTATSTSNRPPQKPVSLSVDPDATTGLVQPTTIRKLTEPSIHGLLDRASSPPSKLAV